VANRADLVPKLPLPLPIPYDHVDTLEELVPRFGQVDLSIVCMHHLTTYLWMMSLLAGGTTVPLTDECKPKPVISIA
jgi:hypothetical protein